MKLWAIYYGDGSIFTDEDGSPFDAPRTNVQIIVEKHPRLGWELFSQSEYFYYEPETRGFYHADIFTVFSVLIRSKAPLILFGQMISDEKFEEITLKMLDDLPSPKTSWRRGTPSWLKGR